MRKIHTATKKVIFSHDDLIALIHKQLDEEGYIIHFEFSPKCTTIEKVICTKTTEIK